jgi:hypothetical protein
MKEKGNKWPGTIYNMSDVFAFMVKIVTEEHAEIDDPGELEHLGFTKTTIKRICAEAIDRLDDPTFDADLPSQEEWALIRKGRKEGNE